MFVVAAVGLQLGALNMQREIRSDLEKSRLNTAIGILFNYDERWLDFFYSHKGGGLRCEPTELIAEASCFSRGEQIMIKVALDLWTNDHRASISEIIEYLDWINLNRVLLAIMTMRDITVEDLADAGSRYEG